MNPHAGKAGRISQPGQRGVILSTSPINLIAGETGFRPEGLYLRTSTGSASVIVRVGAGLGASATRRLTLGERGAWLSVAGWQVVGIDVESVSGTDVAVSYAWTATPPNGDTFLYVAALDSSGTAIAVPEGARKVATSAALAGLTFRSSPAGAALDLSVPTSAGIPVDVLGTHYVNATPGVIACWFIEPF